MKIKKITDRQDYAERAVDCLIKHGIQIESSKTGPSYALQVALGLKKLSGSDIRTPQSNYWYAEKRNLVINALTIDGVARVEVGKHGRKFLADTKTGIEVCRLDDGGNRIQADHCVSILKSAAKIYTTLGDLLPHCKDGQNELATIAENAAGEIIINLFLTQVPKETCLGIIEHQKQMMICFGRDQMAEAAEHAKKFAISTIRAVFKTRNNQALNFFGTRLIPDDCRECVGYLGPITEIVGSNYANYEVNTKGNAYRAVTNDEFASLAAQVTVDDLV